MTRGPRIKGWVKWYIRTESLKARGESRDSVAERIERYLAGKEPVPGRETLLRMISQARNDLDPEDKPWSVSALPAFEIPPEALPVVIKAWAERLEAVKQSREVKPHNAEHARVIRKYITPLTIREAKWYGRLYHIYKDRNDRKGEIELSSIVANLAAMEKALKQMGAYLWQGAEDKLEDMSWLWQMDALLHYHLTGKTNLNLATEMARSLLAEKPAKNEEGGTK
jgi:hypothetical protein